jgi:hypothetical protein
MNDKNENNAGVRFTRIHAAAAVVLLAVIGVIALTIIPGVNLFGALFSEPSICNHAHDEECGYIEYVPCDHEHDEYCGFAEAEPCEHEHDEYCGYTDETPCEHFHDEYCSYAEAALCEHFHGEYCSYAEEAPCRHEHDRDCGGLQPEEEEEELVLESGKSKVQLALEGVGKSGSTKWCAVTTPHHVPAAGGYSHTQGHAVYSTNNGDFHLFPYSNVNGYPGYIYISGPDKGFTLSIPEKETRFKDVSSNKGAFNPHFNHPCGMQVIEDYLVVPVIPFHSTQLAYDAAIVYVYDLSPLKNGSKPGSPKEIMRFSKVNGKSMSCAGVAKMSDGKYVIGLVSDANLDIHISKNAPSSLWGATWSNTPDKEYKLKSGDSGNNHYQSIGFVVDPDGFLYMLGFDRRVGKDLVDLYRLYKPGIIWESTGDLKAVKHSHHLECKEGSFSNGGSVHMRDGVMEIYSVEKYYYGNGFDIDRFTSTYTIE